MPNWVKNKHSLRKGHFGIRLGHPVNREEKEKEKREEEGRREEDENKSKVWKFY